METKIKETIEFYIQVLGILSIVVLALFFFMIMGIASGNVPHHDTSTFSEITKWLFHHPSVLLINFLFVALATRIWLREEKK